MRSAWRMVDRRWAMIRAVLPAVRVRRFSWIALSVSVSTELVA
jgi:hypothetical protein